ncbi:MAG: hypothetical protein AVDCRST_MAG70-1204 [uncultured Thermomicrobiales bacterium]|uniref:Uncharacterized protein n=1 Tax=uncultured Thermomicrobiales bacterium TaxID=1645740 RepID=A0A6J4US67_9BACT|nr:MAG: hypothetical protein AVDCRST_MAG70-1204 [uncultured Thermomicrobiales bacterium]
MVVFLPSDPWREHAVAKRRGSCVGVPYEGDASIRTVDTPHKTTGVPVRRDVIRWHPWWGGGLP